MPKHRAPPAIVVATARGSQKRTGPATIASASRSSEFAAMAASTAAPAVAAEADVPTRRNVLSTATSTSTAPENAAVATRPLAPTLPADGSIRGRNNSKEQREQKQRPKIERTAQGRCDGTALTASDQQQYAAQAEPGGGRERHQADCA